ncbi:hypothetical protein BKA69DRAFT_1124929 [Paraphysoderma sedebokerense]|nr:hypothetical protein BKA69DRAFT_1124929 [Paraphysoderma sedebokerense]
MFEAVIANLLNKILGDYVDNLEQKQLNVGIWAGDVVLRNLKLKKDALDKFDLPITVLEGYLGELTLKIPWQNLKGKPFRVYIDNVFLIATPKAGTQFDPAAEEERAWKRKQDLLETMEIISQPTASLKSDTEDDKKRASFTTQLVTKIIDNLQISINNIHIRYEDKISNPQHPFSVGITLAEFSAVSTDANWVESFIDLETDVIHKYIKLGHLSVYWNTDSSSLLGKQSLESIQNMKNSIPKTGSQSPDQRFILRPVTGVGKVVINKKFGSETPKYDGVFDFDEFSIALDDYQYRDFWLMLGVFDSFVKGQQYQKFRPAKGITPKSNPKAWWKFAIKSVMHDIHEHNEKWTWNYIKQRKEDKKRYIQLYKDKKLEKIQPEAAKELRALEMKLSVDDIRLFRRLADRDLKKEKALAAKQPKSKSTLQSWSTWVWGSKGSQESEETLTEDDIQRLYNTIDFDESSALEESTLPPDCILYRVTSNLKCGSFVLERRSKKVVSQPAIQNPNEPLLPSCLSVVFQSLKTSVLTRLNGQCNVETGIGDFNVWDGWTESTVYPLIIRTKKNEREGVTLDRINLEEVDEGQEVSDMQESPSTPFFNVEYQFNPPELSNLSRIVLRSRSLEVIYNPFVIDAASQFFTAPESAAEPASALQAAAQNTLNDLKLQTRAGLEYALVEHKSFDLDLCIDAPIFIIPEDCTKKDSLLVVLDSGHVKVKSDLISKERKEEIQSKQGSEMTSADLDALHSLMYDKFSVDLTSVQLLVGSSLSKCLEQLDAPCSGDLHVIDRINISFMLSMSILPQAANLTRMKICGSLPLLKLNLSDRKYKVVMKIIDLVSGSSPTSSQTEPSKPDLPTAAVEDVPDTLGDSFLPFRRAADQRRTSLSFSNEENTGVVTAVDQGETEKDIDDGETTEDIFYDASEENSISISMEQQLIEFKFEIQKVLISLKKTEKGQLTTEKTLAEMELHRFGLEFIQRAYDRNVHVWISSLHIIDRLQNYGEQFRHLATSTIASSEQHEDLVSINYLQVDSNSPEFVQKYDGIEQHVDLTFQVLKILVTRSSILELYDFILATFVSESSISSNQNNYTTTGGEQQNELEGTVSKPVDNGGKMMVKARMKSVDLEFNNDGSIIGDASLGESHMSLLMSGAKMNLQGNIGNLILSDRSQEKDKEAASRLLLTIEQGQVATFTYNTFTEGEADYPGYDSDLQLKAGSVRFIYLPSAISSFSEYFSEFARMHFLWESARQAAVESTSRQKAQKFHFDAFVSTPILVFPDVDAASRDHLVAYLGEISANNTFANLSTGVASSMKVDISKTRLESVFYYQGREQILRIIEGVDIHVLLNSFDRPAQSWLPASEVVCKVSDVNMQLTERQYEFLMRFVYSLGSNPQSSSAQPSTQQSPSANSIEASQVDRNISTETYTTTDVTFSLGKITLELLTGNAFNRTNLAEISLAHFSIHEIGYKMAILSHGGYDAELYIGKMSVQDTRSYADNHFKSIITPIARVEHQIIAHIFTTTDGSMLISATVDSPRVILVLDHLFALKTFFVNNLPVAPEDAAEEAAAAVAQRSQSSKSEQSTLSYRINVVDPEIIALENPAVYDTKAVVLNAKQLQFWQEHILGIKIDNIALSLCQMHRREDTIFSFIPPTELSVVMDSHISNQGYTIVNVTVDSKQIVAKVSYHDVILISAIGSKLAEVAGRTIEPPEITTSFTTDTENTLVASVVANHERIRRSGSSSSGFSSKSAKGPQVLLTNETLRLSVDGVRIIVIDDLSELNLPMLDLALGKFVVEMSDWSTLLRLNTTISVYANYFNLRNSQWEPLVEPWSCNITMKRSSENSNMIVDIFSRKKLDVNVSHTFVEALLSALHKWSTQSASQVKPADKPKPFILRNRTGYKLALWKETVDSSDVELTEMVNNMDLPFSFEDWRRLREVTSARSNKVSLQIRDIQWECLKGIGVDREGVHAYPLRPKINNVSHKLVCEVKLENQKKIITFRSAYVIVNRCMIPIEILVLVPNSTRASNETITLEPGSQYSLPIEYTYHSKVRVRPEENFGFSWSSQHIHWSDFRSSKDIQISCSSLEPTSPSFRFHARAEYDDSEMDRCPYPSMTVNIGAAINIENLLPFGFQWLVKDVKTAEETRGYLQKGGIVPVHTVDYFHTLAMSIAIPDLVYRANELAIIHDAEDDYRDESMTLVDQQNLKLVLRIQETEMEDCKGSKKLQIYSPYVMINNTGLEMVFKERSLLQGWQYSAGQGKTPTADGKALPYMFSYSTFDPLNNRAVIKVGSSEWSNPLSFNAVGAAFEVILPSVTGTEELSLGVTVNDGPGKFQLSKVVTFTPRFIVKNNCDADIQWRQSSSSRMETVPRGQQKPVMFLRISEDKLLSFRFQGLVYDWSGLVNIQEIGETYVKLCKMSASNDYDAQDNFELLRVDILLDGATVFIIVNKAKRWPYRIENLTDTEMVMFQKDTRNRYKIPAGKSVQYTWDNPSLREKSIVLQVGGYQREINLKDVGSLPPWEFIPPDSRHIQTAAVDIHADGSTLILQLSGYVPSRSIFRQTQRRNSSSSASTSSRLSAQDRFEVVDVNSTLNFAFHLKLEGVGVSVINSRVQELMYITLRNLEFTYRDTSLYQTFGFLVKWIQIDNQLYGGIEPIVLYPTVIPKEGQDADAHPTFHAALVKSKDTSHGVPYYKYFTALLQEISLEIDEDFAFSLLEFLQFKAPGWDVNAGNNASWDEVLVQSEPKVTQAEDQMYFEVFYLQPLKLNVTFVRTMRLNQENIQGSKNPISFLFNVLTMGLANVHDAPIKLNALLMEHPIVSTSVLVDRIIQHYGQEVVGQLHKIIGSADVLGNPVGLFNNISSGVVDIFYEPYQGFVSDRPQDFGKLLAKGTANFFKKTVYGLSDTFSRFTGSIGKGLSAATMDEDFQHNRSLSKARNRPKHAVYGVTTGAKSFAKSVVSGVTGVVTKPLEGAEKGGVEGFFKGFGKGIVGVVAKPMVGIFDLASNVSEGIKNTTTVFEENELDRVRQPRFIAKDSILRVYSERESLGQAWLRQLQHGKYVNEFYVAHLETKVEDFVCILTNSTILMVRIKKVKLEWELPLNEVSGVRADGGGGSSSSSQGNQVGGNVVVNLKHHEHGRYRVIPAPDHASALWFTRQIDELVQQYLAESRPLD